MALALLIALDYHHYCYCYCSNSYDYCVCLPYLMQISFKVAVIERVYKLRFIANKCISFAVLAHKTSPRRSSLSPNCPIFDTFFCFLCLVHIMQVLETSSWICYPLIS